MNFVARRGACPGLTSPMPTGDGLLVRLTPIETMAVSSFIELCAAAREHGNGVMEITARGSVQVRGLNATSAPRLAATVAALGIAIADGVSVLTNALAGIDAAEIFDAAPLAADLRIALARESLAARLAPKGSVIIDGGGLDIGQIFADVRLCAELINGKVALRIAVGAEGGRAVSLGVVKPEDGGEAAMRLLQAIAHRGRHARSLSVLAAEEAAPFRAALARLPSFSACPESAQPSHTAGRRDPIGAHRLRNGLLAYGVGLAFGHADASSLAGLADAAEALGASGVCAALGRVLIAIGLPHGAGAEFAAQAKRLGFIVAPDDPRRFVIACAGAPLCASGKIAARTVAPFIAETVGRHLGASLAIHISGCAKGCAHPAPAALTIAGADEGCALIANGSAGDAPQTVVPTNELADAVARLTEALVREAADA